MKIKEFFFNIGFLFVLFVFNIEHVKGYILSINVVDKDDLFVFLHKNEQLLATSYYNFKPSYFFSFDKGEINIDLKIDYKEGNSVKRRNKKYEVVAKTNKNSINIMSSLNVNNDFFKKNRIDESEGISFNHVQLFKAKGGNLNESIYNLKIEKLMNLDNTYDTLNRSVTNKPLRSSNLYLILITAKQWLNYIKLKNKLEPSLKNEENYIFTSHFNCVKRYPLYKGTFKKTIKVEDKNRYMLFLINNNKMKLNMKGTIVFYDNETKHLSHDFLFVPDVLLATSVILFSLVIIMTACSIRYKLKLDIFMSFNMLFFFLSIYFNYKNINFIKDNGYMYVYYWVSASIAKKIQEIISIIIYLQVSLGDTYIRNRLSRMEIQFMICFAVISFYTGLFEIFLGNFQAPRYILQAFAYLFIFIAINFTFTFLSARLTEENLSYHVAKLYKKHDIIKKYRLIFFAIILKPIVLVIYKVLCLSPSSIDLYSPHEFFYVFFDIAFDIVLYITLFALFRPAEPIKLLKHVLSHEDFRID